MTPLKRHLFHVMLSASLLCQPALAATPPAVAIRQDDKGNFTLLRDGEPYLIHGAGGSSHLKDLVKYGGNSIRTWGIDSLDEKIDGKPLLDYCQELGITVTAGIWIGHQRHGFDYSDETQLKKQRDMVREAVRKYRGHPALLMWGLGNEMEGPESDGKDTRIWKELNVLAAIVKEEDPGHPVMTVIAGAAESKVKGILGNYPNIDVLGVNAYAGASGAIRAVKQAGWKKPFVLTEFGPQGHWEVSKTSWNAPIEPTSRNKAASYYATLSLLAENTDICLGSYVFLWGQKQEVTSTWYGMFLSSGEKLPTVDAVCRAWTGKWPDNRAPRITTFETPLKEATVAPGQTVTVTAAAEDPESDTMTWEWSVCEESIDRRSGGDAEAAPPAVSGSIVSQENGAATIKTPVKPGNYRLFVIVRDGKGGASADNTPFRVAR
ncbi:MAG: glycoside hydrolase family 2 TIM barrel-domain containing protein [Luteolibacter sp.]|uniref:glycoside hydrolase family 2 TIM barrel-domain containing protein n=1 Tax=Luteolibacter sp. TaxID=1962973 RepID=UPI003266BBDD